MVKKVIINILFLINFVIVDATQKKHFVTVSIPKAGTHLLLKALRLMSNKSHISPKGFCLIDDASMRRFLSRGVHFATHAIHTAENIKKINRDNIRTFFIYRDPRDQIVSTAFYIKKIKQQPFATWELDTLITELIKNSGFVWSNTFNCKDTLCNAPDIISFYNLYLPWKTERNVYTTTFEKLVGSKGGGNDKVQVQEIINIAQHMELQLNRQQANEFARKLFGETPTFHEGKIGSWKKYFSEQDKIDFKNIPGACELLINLGYEIDANW